MSLGTYFAQVTSLSFRGRKLLVTMWCFQSPAGSTVTGSPPWTALPPGGFRASGASSVKDETRFRMTVPIGSVMFLSVWGASNISKRDFVLLYPRVLSTSVG